MNQPLTPELIQIKDGFIRFTKEHGHSPTATEIDNCPYLLSTRQIQRKFGGLVMLRKTLNLDAQSDMRSGKHSTDRAYMINKRAHELEQGVYTYLIKRFGKPFVHREYFFTDDKRTRADFFIYDSAEGFCVDVFYPSDRRNLIGCLNNKLDKYNQQYMDQYPVIFLQMNGGLDQELLNEVVAKKTKEADKRAAPINLGELPNLL